MSDAVTNRPRRLTQDVYERLRADILACCLVPGTKLRINQCGAPGNVSLGAMREGLPRLAANGLAIAEPQRGFTVISRAACAGKRALRLRSTVSMDCGTIPRVARHVYRTVG